MNLISYELEERIDNWRYNAQTILRKSIGILEKEIVENDFVTTVLCLYYIDENGEKSDNLTELIITAMTGGFGLKYHSKQSFACAGNIRRELYFTV